MTDEDGTWVQVMRTEPEAVASVRRALTEAGIAVQVFDGSGHSRLASMRASMAAVEIHVPAPAAERARRVLSRYMAAGDARVQGHLRSLPAELLAFVGWGGLLVGVLLAWRDGLPGGWPWLVGALLCGLLGWKLRHHLRSKAA